MSSSLTSAVNVNRGVKSRPDFLVLDLRTTCSLSNSPRHKPPQIPARRSHTSRPRSPPTLSSISPSLPSRPGFRQPWSRNAHREWQSSGVSQKRFIRFFRTTLPREPCGRRRLYHLTRSQEGQWRRPCCAGGVLEGVGFQPALTAVLATEEGLRLGSRPAGKGDRPPWLSSPSSPPRSQGKGILLYSITAHLSVRWNCGTGEVKATTAQLPSRSFDERGAGGSWAITFSPET